MKPDIYYLFDKGKQVARSGNFERLLNMTTKATDAKIYYNNITVWMQNPQNGIK